MAEEEYDHPREGHGRRASDCGDTCGSHSGITAGIKGLYALLITLISLFGIQMIFQIPTIKIDILNGVTGITARIVELEKKDIEFKAGLDALQSRISTVEKAGRGPE